MKQALVACVFLLHFLSNPAEAQTSPKLMSQADRTTLPIQRAGSIDGSDYPEQSLLLGEQGRAVATFTVSYDGRVVDCTASGATPMLNSQTCALIMRRFRFAPARDASGNPVVFSGLQRSVNWKHVRSFGAVPESDPRTWISWLDAPNLEEKKSITSPVTFKWVISDQGKPSDCRVVKSSGNGSFDDMICRKILQRALYDPAFRPENGRRINVSSTDIMTVDWLASKNQSSPILYHENIDVWKKEKTLGGWLNDPSSLRKWTIKSLKRASAEVGLNSQAPANLNSEPVKLPLKEPSKPVDANLETAIERCRRIGFKESEPGYRECVLEQIRLLSNVK